MCCVTNFVWRISFVRAAVKIKRRVYTTIQFPIIIKLYAKTISVVRLASPGVRDGAVLLQRGRSKLNTREYRVGAHSHSTFRTSSNHRGSINWGFSLADIECISIIQCSCLPRLLSPLQSLVQFWLTQSISCYCDTLVSLLTFNSVCMHPEEFPPLDGKHVTK